MAKAKLPTEIINQLAEAFGKSPKTIYRWVANKNILLTTPKAQEILRSVELPEALNSQA